MRFIDVDIVEHPMSLLFFSVRYFFFTLAVVGFLFIIKSFVIHNCMKLLRQFIAFLLRKN